MKTSTKMAPRPLVGVTITGGLGNQLFQYAAGLALSERLGAELRCDTYHYHHEATRRLALAEFGISWTECRNPNARGALRAIARWFGVGRRAPFGRTQFLLEEFGRFDPRVDAITESCYLEGYFQSWRYFEGHEASVRRVFDLNKISSRNAAPMEAKIRAARHPVAVHIRRGDYATQPLTLAFHGLLGADYYNEARRAIEAEVSEPTYFLFSDDPDAATAELGDWPNLIPIGGFTAPEDLKLMALCEHFIIANSTFSWWGAWLGGAPGKRVVAPQNWFAPSKANTTVLDDRYPPEWSRV
jgi:hypothetical protein